jgi:hypothetical protein
MERQEKRAKVMDGDLGQLTGRMRSTLSVIKEKLEEMDGMIW